MCWLTRCTLAIFIRLCVSLLHNLPSLVMLTRKSPIRLKASNQLSSSFGKRDRAPSSSGAPQNVPKRLRAHDLEGAADPAVDELFKGPDNWVNLRKMLTSGAWLTRRQQAGVVQQDSQMGLEPTSTHIHDTGMYTAQSGRRQETLAISFMQNAVSRSHLFLSQRLTRIIAWILRTKSNSSTSNGRVM